MEKAQTNMGQTLLAGTCVWGAPYVRCFLDWHLPMLMAPGNFPALPFDIDYTVYTTQAHVEEIDNSPAVQRLRDLCRSVRVMANNVSTVNKYGVMAGSQRHLVEQAWEQDVPFIFTFPDHVISDGSFATVAKHVEAGYRAVMHQSISCNRDEFLADLQARMSPQEQGVVSVTGRLLVDVATKHYHARTLCQTYNRPNFHNNPAMVFWDIGENGKYGMLMRAFHMSPIFIHPTKPSLSFRKSLDGDYPDFALDSYDQMAFLTDSDDYCGLELTENHGPPGSTGTATPRYLAEWANCPGKTSPFNRRFVEKRFWFHNGNTPSDVWERVKRDSDAVVDECNRLIDTLGDPPTARAHFLDDPYLVEYAFHYNIVAWGESYYGVPMELGPVNIKDPEVLAGPSVLKATYLDEIRALVKAQSPWSTPQMEWNLGGYQAWRVKDYYYIVPADSGFEPGMDILKVEGVHMAEGQADALRRIKLLAMGLFDTPPGRG